MWSYFELKEEKNKYFAECIVNGCKDKLVYHKSTSLMINHLKFNHLGVYEVFLKKNSIKQITLAFERSHFELKNEQSITFPC